MNKMYAPLPTFYSENLKQSSDFDNFKLFTHKWNTDMPMQEKMKIAMDSDTINNRGAVAYQNGI